MSLLLAFFLAAFIGKPSETPIQLQAGMTITKSMVIKKGVYRLPSASDDGSQSVIAINGSNLTVDFNGAELVGTPADTPPDRRQGTALRVTGRNITIKNLGVRGYKIGLIARDAPQLRILDSDFSYNWKQHLKSNLWVTSGANAASPLPATMKANGQAIVTVTDDYQKRFATEWSPWLERLDAAKQERIRMYAPAPLAGGISPFLRPGQLRGRRYILVDEWGPYDFKSPRLWPRGEQSSASGRTGVRRFELLGPPGRWRLITSHGVGWISARAGRVPGFIDVRLPQDKAAALRLELEYTGAAIVSPVGVYTAKGKPYRFGYGK